MHNRVVSLVLTVIVSFLLVACNDNTSTGTGPAPSVAAPSLQIGIIVEEKIYKDSNATKSAVSHLDSLSREFEPKLAHMKEEMEKNPDDKNLKERMNTRFLEMQQIFSTEQERVTNRVMELYTASRDVVRKNNNMAVILASDQVLGYDPAADITQLVINEMDKTKIDFSQPDEVAPASVNGTTAPASVNGTTAPDADADPLSEAAPVNATAPIMIEDASPASVVNATLQ